MSEHWSGTVYNAWIGNPDGTVEPGIMLVEENGPRHKVFSLPGGKQEPGETPEETAIRETGEESCYAVLRLGKLLRKANEIGKGSVPYNRYFFEIEQAEKIDDKEVRFFPLTNLPKNLKPRHKEGLFSIFRTHFQTLKKLRAQTGNPRILAYG